MIGLQAAGGRASGERSQALGRPRKLRLRETRPGAELELLVLAAGDGGCVGVDLASGAFVRASWPAAVVDPSVADLTDPEWHAAPAETEAGAGVGDLRGGLEEASRATRRSRPLTRRLRAKENAERGGGREESGAGGRFRRWGGFLGLDLDGQDKGPTDPGAAGAVGPGSAHRPERDDHEPISEDLAPRTGTDPEPLDDPPTAHAPAGRPTPARGHLQPLCLVRGRIAPDPPLFDPSRPEAVLLEEPPLLFGGAGPLQARRILGSLVAPVGRPLLGSNGPSIAYWQLQGTHGSVALVEVGRELALRWGTDGGLRARFRWGGTDQDLPVLDATLVDDLADARTSPIPPAALRRRLGWEPHFLVAALTGPRGGHCYKVVASALPRP